MNYAPKDGEAISYEAAKAFLETPAKTVTGKQSTVEVQVNELMNGLGYIAVLRNQGAEDDALHQLMTPPLKLQFRPEMQNYQGLSDMADIKTLLSAHLSDI